MDESLQEFVVETRESLNALDLDLLRLEKNPKDKDLINRVFRLVHTVKGNCGFLNLPRLENVTHHTETILGRYRSGALEVTPDSVSLLLQSLDRIKSIVGTLAETGEEPKGDDKPLLALLDLASLTAKPAAAPIMKHMPIFHARLGIAPGVLSAPDTGSASTASTASTDTPTYGLGFSGTLDISTKMGADMARSQLLTVLSNLQKTYQTANTPVQTNTAVGNTTGTASPYQSAQLANYSLALSLLGG